MLRDYYDLYSGMVANGMVKLAADASTQSKTFVQLLQLTFAVPLVTNKILVVASFSGYNGNNATTAGICWRLDINGVKQSSCFTRCDITRNGSKSGMIVALSDSIYAEHDIRLYWRREPTTGTGTIYCSPVSLPDEAHAQISAFALR